MKRVILITLFISTIGVLRASAQQEIYMLGDIKAGMGDFNNGVQFAPLEFTASTCYAPNKTLLFGVDFMGTFGLFEKDDMRDYQVASALGLRAGVNMFHIKESYVQFGASAGGSVLNQEDWKFTYVDGGLRWLDICKHNVFFGLGVRYYKSRTSQYQDFTTLYMSFGLKLWGYSE